MLSDEDGPPRTISIHKFRRPVITAFNRSTLLTVDEQQPLSPMTGDDDQQPLSPMTGDDEQQPLSPMPVDDELHSVHRPPCSTPSSDIDQIAELDELMPSRSESDFLHRSPESTPSMDVDDVPAKSPASSSRSTPPLTIVTEDHPQPAYPPRAWLRPGTFFASYSVQPIKWHVGMVVDSRTSNLEDLGEEYVQVRFLSRGRDDSLRWGPRGDHIENLLKVRYPFYYFKYLYFSSNIATATSVLFYFFIGWVYILIFIHK